MIAINRPMQYIAINDVQPHYKGRLDKK